MTSVQTYIQKVKDLLLRPDLASNKKDQQTFLYSLLAHWQREINNIRSGKPSPYTILQIDEIKSEIEKLLLETRKE